MDIQQSIERIEGIRRKGFLGPSLKENQSLPSVGMSAARSAGITVDNDGKMRCPDGSPGAGTFTDFQQSNCKVPNVSDKKSILTPEVIEFKVGLFNSRTRLGRGLQAAGTYALPGDTSRLRNPVSSESRRALTPGGGGGGLGPRLRGRQLFRCPPGYENGGRFSGRNLSSCGRRIFTPAVVAQGVDAANGPESPRGVSAIRTVTGAVRGRPGKGSSRVIEAGAIGNPVQVSRRAAIPELGTANPNKRSSSVLSAVRAARKDKAKSFLVRQDGAMLAPSVPMATLARQKNNRDMKGGTIVAFGSKSTFGKAELPVLINSPAKSLAIALPGDGHVVISKNRNLTASEKNAVSAAMRGGGVEKVAELSKASGGALSVSVEGVRDAQKMVRVQPASGGASRMVPNWVYNTYLQRSAPGREGRDIWVIVKDS